jgi:hypothetical protein
MLSAALSWTLIPIASAEAPPMLLESDETSDDSSVGSSGDAQGDARFQQLNTVPEDGLGNEAWLSGATRIVREITLKRPNEDLVICIGGCLDKQARVVFAQPAEIVSKKPADTMSDAAPATVKPVMAKAADAPLKSSEPVTTHRAATESVQEKLPAIAPAAKASASGDVQKPAFEPTISAPPAATTAPAVKPAAQTK